MTESQIALLLSIVSAIAAGVALGWNIYRDLLKPRIKTRISLNVLLTKSGVQPGPRLIVSGTNFGPGEIKLNRIFLRPPWLFIKRLFRKGYYEMLTYDDKNPESSQLPARVQVGDHVNFILEYNKDCFLKDSFSTIGISDSFGRAHWAPKKDYHKVTREFNKEFREAGKKRVK